MSFYLIPSRKLVAGGSGLTNVTSINNLRGDLNFTASNGLQINISSSNIDYSVIPNTFVRIIGDTITGNLQFSPSANKYGLRLLSVSADPTSTSYSDTGAIYYNTVSATLRIYNGTAWVNLANTGALDETQANGIYLRLDGGNDPMQGDLSMGSYKFRLGNLSSTPSGGNLGELIFRTDLDAAQIYTTAGWSSIGGSSGVTQIIASTGLTGGTITTTGTIAVDLTYNFNWSGTHTHSSAIVFASTQTVPTSYLRSTSQAQGDILIATSTTDWQSLALGSPNQVLAVNGTTNLPEWTNSVGGLIGLPDNTDGHDIGSDAVYTDGFFDDWTGTTSIGNAFDDVNELFLLLAPARANVLTSQNLVLSGNSTLYSAKLSDGLPTEWYQNGFIAGSTISSYMVAGNYTLATPSTTNTFRAGKANNTATYGTFTHNRFYNGSVDTLTYSVGSGVGTSGTGNRVLAILTIDPYPTTQPIWSKATGRVVYTQTNDGYERHSLQHTEAGISNPNEFWLDTFSNGGNANPSFNVSATAVEITPVLKYLSGLPYYAFNSTFRVEFSSNTGIYNRCYNSSQVFRISAVGMSNYNWLPSTPPVYTTALDRTGGNFVTITLNAANQSTNTAKYLTTTLYKATGNSVSQNATISYGICTYGTVSTTTYEAFFDEAQRIKLGTTTAWDSTKLLTDTSEYSTIINAQVRNGELCYPVSSEYSNYSFTGDQEYERFFYKTSASTGSLTFTGFSISNISPYGTGSVNVLIYLDTDNKYFDLGVAVGLGGDASSRANAAGAKNAGSTGGLLNWSIGTFTTGPTGSGNLGRYRLIIIFRDTTYLINSITST